MTGNYPSEALVKTDDQVSNNMALLSADADKPTVRLKENSDKKNVAQEDTFNIRISPISTQQSDDEARLERLLAIRHQLAEGTYNISGKDVADKILKVLKG